MNSAAHRAAQPVRLSLTSFAASAVSWPRRSGWPSGLRSAAGRSECSRRPAQRTAVQPAAGRRRPVRTWRLMRRGALRFTLAATFRAPSDGLDINAEASLLSSRRERAGCAECALRTGGYDRAAVCEPVRQATCVEVGARRATPARWRVCKGAAPGGREAYRAVAPSSGAAASEHRDHE